MRDMTEKVLSEAFAGESQAHMKYLIFSDVAKNEGFPNISRLFRAIAYAERVHATNHAKNLGFVNETDENLKAGIEGETYEIEEMYPAYDAIARLQNEKGAQTSIRYTLAAERIHAGLYQEGRQAVESGNDLELKKVYVCPVCGSIHLGEAPERCPVCNLPGDKFQAF